MILAIPSIASFATMTLTGTCSLIMLGHLGALIIAIVGVTNIVMYNVWALFSGIGHTINYLVAQNYGADDMKKGIERTYIALYLCLIMAGLVFLTGVFGADFILRTIGGSEELALAGHDYLQIRFYAMAFGIFNFVFHGFFRGIGDTKTPMILSLAGSAAVIFFTYVLTYGKIGFPEFGLNGAGYAFLIGEAVGLLGCLYVYFIRLHSRFRTRSRVRFNRPEFKLIFAESGKLGVQEFAMSISMFIFTVFVSRLGTEALAANEIALNIMSIGFMPAFAFGATATILVGQEIGRGNPHIARRMGTDIAILGSIFLLLLGTVEFFFAETIARIYTDDQALYHLVAYLIMISAFMQVFDGMFNFFAGGLRGIGETTFLFIAAIIVGFGIFVPLAYIMIFVLNLGSVGAWLALYIYITVFALALMLRFYKTDWMSIRIKVADGSVSEQKI